MSVTDYNPCTKFGFCRASERWVPRDEMLSINVKVYNAKNEETRIPIRLSADSHERFVAWLATYEWDNELRTGSELSDADVTPGEPLPVFEPAVFDPIDD